MVLAAATAAAASEYTLMGMSFIKPFRLFTVCLCAVPIHFAYIPNDLSCNRDWWHHICHNWNWWWVCDVTTEKKPEHNFNSHFTIYRIDQSVNCQTDKDWRGRFVCIVRQSFILQQQQPCSRNSGNWKIKLNNRLSSIKSVKNLVLWLTKVGLSKDAKWMIIAIDTCH